MREKIITIPRSQAFAAMKLLKNPTPASIRDTATEVFPWPLEKITWGYALSKPQKNGTVVIITGVMKENIFPQTPQGHCLNFVADWIWFLHTRPQVASQGTFALINSNARETEITILHEGFPIFCRSFPAPSSALDISNEINKILTFLRRSLDLPLDNRPSQIAIPPREDNQFLLLFSKEIPWINPPQDNTLPLQKAWKKHQNLILATLSILLVGSSVGLRKMREEAQIQLKVMAHSHEKNLSPENALKSFLTVASETPSKVQLTRYRYDTSKKGISIDGRAADYETLSTFLASLSKQNLFKDVRSEKSRLIKVGDQSVVDFSAQGVVR